MDGEPVNATLAQIERKLQQLVEQIVAVMPNDEPMGVAHGNWSLPGLSRSDLEIEAELLQRKILESNVEELSDSEDEYLKDYVRRLEFLRAHTVGQLWSSNGGAAASAYMLTLHGLRRVLEPVLNTAPKADLVAEQRELIKKLRAMESRLKDVGPRTDDLVSMVDRIERAHSAADQLPTDLESLSEAKQKIDRLLLAAAEDQARMQVFREKSEEIHDQLGTRANEAEAVLKRCETAYSAATSVGLAAAFSERSKALSWSMILWVVGLVVALVAGSRLGKDQLNSLSVLFSSPQASDSVLVLNLMMAILSIGAPIWFGWLATKQIGQRFRLAEDYAFKASISRAYEGFRREAARIDPEMEARLLASALTRLDELPLRLVEVEAHGSPWHELASSNQMKEAMRVVPGFAGQVKDLAERAIAAMRPSKAKAGASAASDVE